MYDTCTRLLTARTFWSGLPRVCLTEYFCKYVSAILPVKPNKSSGSIVLVQRYNSQALLTEALRGNIKNCQYHTLPYQHHPYTGCRFVHKKVCQHQYVYFDCCFVAWLYWLASCQPVWILPLQYYCHYNVHV